MYSPRPRKGALNVIILAHPAVGARNCNTRERRHSGLRWEGNNILLYQAFSPDESRDPARPASGARQGKRIQDEEERGHFF